MRKQFLLFMNLLRVFYFLFFLSCWLLPLSLCKGAKIRAIQTELMGAFLIGREGFQCQETHDPGLVAILQ